MTQLKIIKVLLLLAVVPSDVMYAVVGVKCSHMVWDVTNAATVAFIWSVPFLAAIVVCIGLAESV